MADVTIPGIANPNTTKFTGGAQPKFRYVYFENAVTKGDCQQWSDTTALLGRGVEDIAASDSPHPAGVATETKTAAGWGWLQTGGYCDYITTDESVAAPGANRDGDVWLVMTDAEVAEGQTAAEVEAHDGGFALNLAADAAAVGVCILCCPYQ